MSTAAANDWGIVAGVIGVLSSIPVLYAIVNSQLPASKLSELERTFEETEDLLRTVTEEGLLKNVRYVAQTKRRLSLIRLEVDDCRAESHCAPTFSLQFKGMCTGLSHIITAVCVRVKLIRASISRTSSAERKRLLAQRGVTSIQTIDDSTLDSNGGASTYFLGDASADTTFGLSFQIPKVEDTHAHGGSPSDDGSSISTASSVNDASTHAAGERGVTQLLNVFRNADEQPAADPQRSLSTPASPKRRERHWHTSRTYSPRALRALLRRVHRDLAIQGRRHPELARFVRSKHPTVKPDRTSHLSTRSKGVREGGTRKLVLDGDERGERGEEDDEWEDEGILAGMPELLVDSPPAVHAESRDRDG